MILLGDLAALSGAVVMSIWLWSFTAGFLFSAGFLRDHAVWFLAVLAWALALAQAYSIGTVLSVGDIIARLLQGAALLPGLLLLRAPLPAPSSNGLLSILVGYPVDCGHPYRLSGQCRRSPAATSRQCTGSTSTAC